MNAEWYSRLHYFNKLIVGFSGGLDSTVLMHLFASHPDLLPRLIAVHINHGISSNASLWQKHCEQFCRSLNVHLITQTVEFDRSSNIEEGARIARYKVFSSLMTEESCLILGHHLDDQAETVLLQLFRGAGVDGLSAMSEFSQLKLGSLARPFLRHSREQLEHYAAFHQLSWIEDESNQDINYSRNYLRQQIMPLLKEKWPGVVKNIARTATHCQQAQRNLDALATNDFSLEGKNSRMLFIGALQEYNFDRIVNILRVWLKSNHIQLPSTATFRRLIDEVIYAAQDAIPEVSWNDVLIRRYHHHLYIDRKNENILPSYLEWTEFPLPLTLGFTGTHLLAKRSSQGLVIPSEAKIIVKFRQGGEKFFWHGQTKRLKKLFQEWEIPPWLRERVPLVYFNDTLAAVVGYAMSDLFFVNESTHAWIFNTEHKNFD